MQIIIEIDGEKQTFDGYEDAIAFLTAAEEEQNGPPPADGGNNPHGDGPAVLARSAKFFTVDVAPGVQAVVTLPKRSQAEIEKRRLNGRPTNERGFAQALARTAWAETKDRAALVRKGVRILERGR